MILYNPDINYKKFSSCLFLGTIFSFILFYNFFNFNINCKSTDYNILLYKEHFLINSEVYFYTYKDKYPVLYYLYKDFSSFLNLSFILNDLNSGEIRNFAELSSLTDKEIIELAKKDANNYVFEAGRVNIVFLTSLAVLIIEFSRIIKS